jgi:hypothetical protein
MYTNCTSQVRACFVSEEKPRVSKAVALAKVVREFLKQFIQLGDK